MASLSGMPFETAHEQWAAGLRRLADAPADQRPTLERVSRRIEQELRRRLGGPFTTDELVDLYDAGTGWASDLAYDDRAPSSPTRGTRGSSPTRRSAATCARPTDYAGGRAARVSPHGRRVNVCWTHAGGSPAGRRAASGARRRRRR